DEIAKITKQMDALSETLQPELDVCEKAATSAQQFTDADKLKKLLTTTSTKFVNGLFNDLNTTAYDFSTDLITNSAPCTPIYQSYEDMGNIACEQMGGGVQGAWAAAGLAALFFLPTVIAVFCVASALRGGKSKQLPPIQSHDENDPFKLPPMQTTQYEVAPAPVRDNSLPRLTVDTSAAALAAAPHSETFTATAPMASAASDPWESSYRHPDVYPYNQPAPATTGHFVDPLVYPAAAVAA
ncbi:hypothetical protein PMAYCL1PPCAC_04512, partial [Pristionchus mayeri]